MKCIFILGKLSSKSCVACLLLFFKIFKVASNRKWTCRRFKTVLHDTVRSTVKAANKKIISFVSFENITFIYRAFQV